MFLINHKTDNIVGVLQYFTGFPPLLKKKFPDISLRKFHNSMRNTFPLMRLLGSQEVVLGQPTVVLLSGEVCNIHKSHYNQSVNEHNLDTWHKTYIPQTGENLSLLGHCHKFPDFFCVSPKFPEFSLS